MGRKQFSAPNPDQPERRPQLIVPMEEAASRLNTRIQEGESFLSRVITSVGELEGLRSDIKIWSDYNTQLLVSLFDSAKFSEEYSDFVGGSFRPGAPISEKVGYEHREVKTYLDRLRSIVARLPLIVVAPSAGVVARAESRSQSGGGRRVFVVHGHDNAMKETVARFLEKLELHPIILHEQPNKGQTIVEKFESSSDVSYAVVLLTPDDVGSSKTADKLQPRARQNGVFELGYFFAKLGRHRVCALHGEGVELPSDIHGLVFVPLDARGGWRIELARELNSAGITVDMNRAL